MRHPLVLALALAGVSCGGGGDGGDGDAPGDNDAAVAGDGGVVIDAPLTGGCGGAGPTGVQNATLDVGGTARTYVLFVPPGYDSARPWPLVFAWHGRTGTAANARQYFGIETVAAGAAIVVYPQGLPVTAEPSDTGWELEAGGRDIAFYDALSAHLRDTYCIGSAYSMGHSFGGYMSNAVGCYRGGTDPGEVRAIAPVAGGGPFGTCPGDPISAVIMHGMNDTVVPFANGEASRNTWRTKAGCDTTSTPIDPSPCLSYDGCDGGRSVRFCVHTDTTFSGHGWPSWASNAAWRLFLATP